VDEAIESNSTGRRPGEPRRAQPGRKRPPVAGLGEAAAAAASTATADFHQPTAILDTG